MVYPVTVTLFPVPTVAVVKVAALPVFTRVTSSAPITPETAAFVSVSVAVVLPLYTLLLAVTPLTDRGAAVMFADNCG